MSEPVPAQGAAKEAKVAWSFILAGFGSLIAASYYDVVRGPLMPPMAAALHLEFTESGWFLGVGHVAATLTTLVMIWALNVWSERTVMVLICAGGLAAGVAAWAVTGLGTLLILAGFLGMTVSTLGTMANILIVEGTPDHLQGRMLAGLHSMYGLGSMAAAAIVGFGLVRGLGWTTFYTAALPVYAALLLFAWLRLSPKHRRRGQRTVQSARLSAAQILVVATFAVYVAGEVTTSVWMTSYLVGIRHVPVSEATPFLSGFFLVFTLARLACAAWLTPPRERAVLRIALLVPLAAFALGYSGHDWAFLGMGVFGAFFPVFLARTSRRFPATWRSLTIWIIVVMNVAIGVANVTLGRLADAFGIRAAFCVPPVLLVAALGLLTCYFKVEERA